MHDIALFCFDCLIYYNFIGDDDRFKKILWHDLQRTFFVVIAAKALYGENDSFEETSGGQLVVAAKIIGLVHFLAPHIIFEQNLPFFGNFLVKISITLPKVSISFLTKNLKIGSKLDVLEPNYDFQISWIWPLEASRGL